MKRATLVLIAALAMLSAITASTALAAAPTPATAPATKVTATSATLNGSVQTNGQDTTYYFQYGTTTEYGSQTPTAGPVADKPPNKPQDVSADVTGLQAQTTYNYRLVTVNADGTTFGGNQVFTTTAPDPNAPTLTIAAMPATIIHGNRTVISGKLSGPKPAGGVAVTLEQNPFPFAGGFKDVRSATTDPNGNYTFSIRPTTNTRYRVSAKTSPPVNSPEVQVNVRLKVTLRVSDRTPARGQRVRFSGLVIPAHDGRPALIQRRTSTGAWKTVATAALKPAPALNGVTRSRYTRRLAIRRTGVYRVRVTPGDSDHLVGRSPTRKLVVH